MNCQKMITLFQFIIKTCKLQQRKCTKYPIICLLKFLKIFLYQGLPFITCVTKLIVCNGTENLSRLRSKTWSLVPQVIRQSASLCDFKSKIKIWTPPDCPCRLCKKYLQQTGLIRKDLHSHVWQLFLLLSHIFLTFMFRNILILQLTLVSFTQFYISLNVSFIQLFYGYTDII